MDTKRGRPKGPETQIVNMRVPKTFWKKAKKSASEEGRTLTGFIFNAVNEYWRIK